MQSIPKWCWVMAGAILLVRLAITQTMGLTPQDAYYFYYAQHPALSYFDHPPMVAYMLYLFTAVLGTGEGAIKITNLLVTTAGLWLYWRLALQFIDRAQALRVLLFWGSSLLVGVLSINTTPDVPLIFCWLLTLLALTQALFQQKAWAWPLAGLLMGLAFCSKYTAVFLGASLVLFLLVSGRYRECWSWRMIALIVAGIVGSLPVLIWNYENEWISFLFQSAERVNNEGRGWQFSPKLFAGHLGTQVGLLLPTLFGGIVYAGYRWIKQYRQWHNWSAQQLFLLCFSVPLMGFFLFVSLFYWVKLNWLMPGYLCLLLLLIPWLSDKLLRWHLALALVLHLATLYQIVAYPVPVKADDTWYGWEAVATEVDAIHQQYPDHFLISADLYKTTALLSYYLPQDTVYCGEPIGMPGYQFALVQPAPHTLIGRDAIYVDSDKRARNTDTLATPPKGLLNHFESIEQLSPILIQDDKGRLLRKYWVYRCQDYQGTRE